MSSMSRTFLRRLTRRALPAALPLLASTPALADDVPSTPAPAAYAIIVGANAGGPGQETLRWAEEDARRVSAVLTELGRFGATDFKTLTAPRAADVAREVDLVAAKLRAHKERGEDAVFFFYYSGHARANAINLGAEELPVSALRERLMTLPSALTLVVLDACQSGAFARVKGAEPAADFSFNSVAQLGQHGMVVMSSSTAQELSQESEELKGSYFTHHLVTGLRGAGDTDGDGRVSLDEAYRYAYKRTLASTSRTQVGSQHATLETDLRGKGDLALTYPARMKSRLELPAALDARVIVFHKPSASAVADVQKASGHKVGLALVAGAYEAVVRRGSLISTCNVTLGESEPHVLDVTSCTPVKDVPARRKGELDEIEHWGIEGGLGTNFYTRGPYTDRLREFGYEANRPFLDPPSLRVSLGVTRSLTRNVTAGLVANTLTNDTWKRRVGSGNDTTSWSSYAATAFVRAEADVAGSWLTVYGQGGGGPGFGRVTFRSTPPGQPAIDGARLHVGWVLSGAAGLRFNLPHHVAFTAQGGYELAPVIDNLLGDTLNVGGFSAQLGMRVRFEEPR